MCVCLCTTHGDLATLPYLLYIAFYVILNSGEIVSSNLAKEWLSRSFSLALDQS